MESSGRLLPAPSAKNTDFQPSLEALDSDVDMNSESDSDSDEEGTGESSSYNCISSPLGSDLSNKIKRKILKLEYVNFADLLSAKEKEESAFQFKDLKGGNTFKLVSQNSKKEINNIEQWTDAFTVYAAVLSEGRPDLAPGLWKYCKFVRETAKRFGGKTFIEYEQFRRQMSHHQLAFQQVHWDLYFSLVNFSKAGTSQNFKTFRPSSGKSQKSRFENGQCFVFESYGNCTKNACKFRHACTHCGKRHQSGKCRSNQSSSEPARSTNPNSGKKSGQLATASKI